MPQFGQITSVQAFRLIGTPDAPTVFDVRIPEDIATLPRLVPTSRLVSHRDIASLTDAPGRAIVVCAKVVLTQVCGKTCAARSGAA